MKLSKEPTNHIIVRAYCGSEWDNSNLAIIAISPEWIAAKKKYFEKAKELHNEIVGFMNLQISDYGAVFLNMDTDSDEHEFLIDIEEGETDWYYVETTEEEIESIRKPENRLKYMIAEYDWYGVRYVSNGEYTGDLFNTETLQLDGLQYKL
jgi:hypothetical protein